MMDMQEYLPRTQNPASFEKRGFYNSVHDTLT